MTDFKGGGVPTPDSENEDINFISQNYHIFNHSNLEEFYKNIIIFIEKYISKKIYQKKIDIFYCMNTDSLKTLEKYENIQPLINSICKTT